MGNALTSFTNSATSGRASICRAYLVVTSNSNKVPLYRDSPVARYQYLLPYFSAHSDEVFLPHGMSARKVKTQESLVD